MFTKVNIRENFKLILPSCSYDVNESFEDFVNGNPKRLKNQLLLPQEPHEFI